MPDRQLLPALLAAIAMTSCRSDGPTASKADPRQLTVQEQLVVNANQRFGLRLLARLAQDAPAENLMISPLSVSMALGMTLNGAAGTTYTEMRNTLGFDEIGRAEIDQAYRGLLEQLRLRDPEVTFTIVNSIWHRDEFPVRAAFLEEARTFFGAAVRSLDFNSPTAPTTINDWVSEATAGRIPELIASIDPLDMMFLINAMYFKAPWSSPFEKAATHAGNFRRDDGRSVQAQLMTQDAGFAWHQGDDIQAVELPYGDSVFSMLLLAPRSGTVNALASALTPEKLAGWLAALRPGRVMLTMPKFTFRYGDELKAALRALGMKAVFVPRVADLSLINASRDDLHVSSVIHKTFIAVDEAGTEAAAATAVTVGVTSLPPSLIFDRAFLFLIRERASGTILFAGIVRDPSRS
jgi:serpin B